MYEKRAKAKAMTLAELKEFVATADMLGAGDQTEIRAEASIGGKLKKLILTDTETSGPELDHREEWRP